MSVPDQADLSTSEQDGTPEEQFEAWLFYMDDALESFMAYLPPEISAHLDYTPTSLDVIEAWILQRYHTVAQIKAEGEERILDGLARYVGETYRKALQGTWRLCNSDPHNAHYGLPELADYALPVLQMPLCPHQLVTASISRQRGTYLRTVLENALQ